MRTKILAGLLFFSVALLNAQTGVPVNNCGKTDSLITNFINAWKITGAEVAIAKNGKLVYNKGFGFSDKKRTSPTKPYNLFRVASISKPVTAIAIMKLVEEGKLRTSDLVFGKDKFLDQPYYLNAITDQRIYSVTIQNLLEHTAGWDRQVASGRHSHSDAPFFPLDVTEEEMERNPVGDSTLIKYTLQKGLNHVPGTTYAYSNTAYLALGKIIEKVTGMSYEEYVNRNVLSPLSLQDIHLGKNLLKDKHEREVEYISEYTTSSCYGDGSLVPWQYGGFNLEAMNAHGGWIGSASDLTKLILSVDGSPTFPDQLSGSTISLMTAPGLVNQNYAKGWCVNKRGNWWHTGSLDGTAAFICKTQDGYVWAVLLNSRADNSTDFWNALDRLPWNCITTLTDSPGIDLYAPTLNVSEIQANVTFPGSAHFNWVNGNGNGRIVLACEDSVFTEFPADGTVYVSNSMFGKGSRLGNAFVVYNGNENWCAVSHLDPVKTYFFRAYEYYKNPATGFMEVYKIGGEVRKKIGPPKKGTPSS